MSSTPRSRLSVGGAMLGGGESSSAGATQTSVQVAVRIRPVTEQDLQSIPSRWRRSILNPLSATSLAVEPGGPPGEGATAASGPSKRQAFSFDRVLSPEDGQAQVYATVQTLIPRFLEGYNATILAYGQTSSGKSYTMGTASGDVDFESLVAGQAPDPQMGIIPRAVAQIFSHIRQTQARSGAVQFTARASFIEIYNEELIDLLADTVDGSRPHVQIREDKAGHIIWSGLREVQVKTVADVMNHLLQGSSVRRTHETEMNAQSSRSHAIFSLTLTQRKYVGGSAPPPPPSAMRPMSTVYGGRTTPTGRTTPSGRSSSSGLPRPASGIPTPGRQSMASPTPGSRATTPSVYGSGGLRPASVAGHLRAASPMPDESGKDGEWVTVTSKFHFVDLAGSERLKRTAAMGDRAKEGISINAGLHALGNVISALGDPAKAKRTTHIPYRDSKLTRLLQDSLGGNAHTLMIACVSPTEYNVSETVNTLQYANRARNIKNKAELNEVEVGWDDVEHLQAVVLKLRKELAALKAASKGAPGGAAALRAIEQKDELEWREKYTTLSQKHSQLTAELTKLQQLTKGQTSNEMSDDFLAAAEPIIVEYEKTVDSLEGQINLMKAALAHSEDLITEQEASLAEHEARATAAEQALEAREATLLDLQARLAKLHDRESSNDGYVRQLETQLQTITTQGDSDSQVLAELRKELVRLRQGESQTEQYVKELEARLAKADESATSLTAQVQRLEADVTRREEAFVELSQRQDTSDTTLQTKQLLEELDGRDLKLLDLEKRLDELRDERDEAVRERGRLNESMAAHELERGELEDRIRELQAGAAAAGALALGAGAGAVAAGALDEEHLPAARDIDTAGEASADANEAKLLALQQDVEALREAETQARAESEALNAKYREALAEIHYLNQQVTELKLSNGAPRTPKPNGVDEDDLEVLTGSSDAGADEAASGISRRDSYQQFSSPSTSRAARMNGGKRPESLLLDRASLSRRSSGSFVGYNPRDRTPRENSALSPLSATAPDALPVSAPAESSPAAGHVRTRSLSQHDGFTSGRRPLSLASSILPSGLKIAGTNGDLTSPSPLSSGYERQIASLEKETMRLQEVLRERDEEIAALEAASKARNNSVPEIRTMHTSDSHSTLASDGTGTNGDSDSDALYVQALSRQESQQSNASAPLTPITEREIASIKQLIAETREEQTDGSDGITRFDDLMRSMARKETTHRERIEELTQELGTQKRDYEALQQLARDQAANMAQEIENLRARLSESDGLLGTPRATGVALGTAGLGATAGAAGAMALQQDKPPVPAAAVDEPVARAAPSNDEAFKAEASRLAADLEQAKEQLSAREKAFEEQLQAARDDHASVLSGRATEHEHAQAELARAHTEAVARQAAEHQELARQTIAQHEQAIASLQEEHFRALASAQEREDAAVAAAQEAALEDAQRGHAAALEQLAGSHAEELQRVQAQAAEGAQQLVSDHSRGLDALRDEHRSAFEASSAQHAAALAAAVAAVHEEHARSLNESDAETRQRHVEALEEHKIAADERLAKDLAAAKLAHDAELSSLRGEHGTLAAHLDELKAAHAAQQEQHAAELAAAVAQRESDVSKLSSEHELAVLGLQAQHEQALGAQAEAHDAALGSLRSEHEQVVAALRETHESAAQEQAAAHEAQLEALRAEHEAKVAEVNADNEAATASMLNVHGLALTGLREQLEALSAAKLSDSSERDALLADHSAALRSSEEQLSQARLAHEQAIEALKSEHATVLLAAQSAAAASAQADHIAALDGLRAEHASALEALQAQHGDALASAEREASEARQALATMQDEHAAQLAQVRNDHAAASDNYMRERAALQEEHASAQQQVKELMTAHSRRLNALTEEHGSKLKELEDSHRQQRDELQHAHAELEDRHRDLLEQNPHEVEVLRTELAETSDALVTLEAALTEAQEERDRFAEELEMLRGPDAEGNVHQELAALRKNLDQQQASLANARSDLLRTKSDIQGLLEERARQDSLLREAQIKLTIAETRANRSRDSGSTNTPPSEGYASATGEFTPANGRSRSPMPRRGSDDQVASSSDHRGSGSRNLSVSTNKPPPLTPPPNMPPPPTPVAAGGTTPTQRQASGARTSTSSILSRPDSPEGLTRSSSITSITASNPSLSGLAQSDAKTAKLLSDQAEEIKSLAKQLNHCEQDLQANIDLVATLEAALNDSERNLRKSRVQLSEVTRERDRYAAQADELRAQVAAAQQEADSARNSVLVEKQSYESRLQAEREAKEKARRALEARLEEVQKKKNSKLFCM